MNIHFSSFLNTISVTWPHQICIGKNCFFERNIFIKYDGIWKKGPSIIIGDNVFIGIGSEFNITKKIIIGNDCLIASGCKFIDHNHGTEFGILMREQKCTESNIEIGNNVWIGANVIILKGVKIGNNSIVAAGALVNKSIPENEIWGGVPAIKISSRKIE